MFEIEGALFVEKREIVEDIAFDAGRLGFGVEGLQFGDDVADRAAAVAALDDLKTRATQAKSTFRHEEHAPATRFVVQAAADGEARLGIEGGSHGEQEKR